MLGARSWSLSLLPVALSIGCGEDTGVDAIDERCLRLSIECDRQGRPVAEICRKVVGWIGAPSPYGVLPAGQLLRPEAERQAMLPLVPDRVAGSTRDGKTVACTTSMGGAFYECRAEAGLRTVRVYVADQSFSESTADLDCGNYWTWEDTLGPRLNFWLSSLHACVSREAEAVTGQLLGYDPALHPPISVTLEGQAVGFDVTTPGAVHSGAPSEITPQAACPIEGATYRCPALGYRTTQPHVLVTSVGDHETRTELSLPVHDCQPELVTRDLTPLPSQPTAQGATLNARLARAR